jgi:hypothetical protein
MKNKFKTNSSKSNFTIHILYRKKNSLRTGFEPVRVTPTDFKSVALTARPSQPMQKTHFILKLIFNYMHIAKAKFAFCMYTLCFLTNIYIQYKLYILAINNIRVYFFQIG